MSVGTRGDGRMGRGERVDPGPGMGAGPGSEAAAAGGERASEGVGLGALLRRHRQGRGLTQEEVAARAMPGLSVEALSKIERGRSRPYRHTLETLCAALGLSESERAALLAVWRGQRRGRPLRDAPLAHAESGLPLLPAPLTPLVGRAQEVAEVERLLARADLRLVTLTGPGGVGKTRLALQIAANLKVAFADGILLIDLAPLRDPDLVLPTIARALRLPDTPAPPLLDQLAARLRPQRLLMVLDNFEHVVGAAPALARVLQACPAVTALVTSQAALRVRGEYEVGVPPLAVPPHELGGGPALDLAAVAQAPAIALFVQRAQAVRPDFAVTEDNAVAVIALCRRLDGLPLALELAAAQLKLFSPQALLLRLERRLPVLVGGAQDLPERQRTLDATLAWSVDLLAPAEQALFRRLAVFVGGCTLEAVEAIAAVEPELALDSVAGVRSLLDKSVLRQEAAAPADTGPRLGMLETVRAYGLGRLAASREEVAVRRAHAAHYLALAEAAAPRLEGAEQAVWIARLERDYDNLRGALQWSRAHAEEQTLGRLVVALAPFWWLRGYLQEGRTWLDAVAAVGDDDDPPSPARASALSWAGRLAVEQGDHGRAAAQLTASLALYRRLGDVGNEARVLGSLGNVQRDRGAFGQATALYEESLALERALGRTRGIARALTNLGLMAYFRGAYEEAEARHRDSLRLHEQAEDLAGIAMASTDLALVARERGAYGRAAALAERGLAGAREVQNQRGIALALLALGLVARDQGETRRAVALLGQSVQLCDRLAYPFGRGVSRAALALALQDDGQDAEATTSGEEALAMVRAVGHSWGLLLALSYRGQVAAAQRAFDHAAVLWREGLTLAQQLGTTWGVPLDLDGLAAVATGQGQLERAAQLLAASAAVRTASGVGLPLVDRTAHTRLVGRLRSAMGASALTAAWAVGHALSPREAIALASQSDATV